MYQFFETIKYENGEFHLLDYHQRRFDSTRSKFFPNASSINLLEVLHEGPIPKDTLQRCKLIYGEKIMAINFYDYQLAEHKSVEIIDAGGFEYSYKYLDRLFFEQHIKGDMQDIWLLKDGFLTDSSYANIALFDGSSWVTTEQVLLAGVKRQFLLDKGFLNKRSLKISDLVHFEKIAFLNAMRDFEIVYKFLLDGNMLHLLKC